MNQKKYLLLLMTVISLVAILDVTYPVLNRFAIDYFAVGKGSSQEIVLFIVVYGTSIILFGALVFAFLTLAGIIEHNFAYELRQKAFEKVQELSFSYFDKTSEGWIISRLTSDIYRITEILSWGFVDFAWGLLTMIGVTVVMLVVNLKLALLVLAVMPPLVFASYWFQTRILKQQRKVRKINSQITAAFSESINGAKTIKSLGIEDIQKDDFEAITTKMKTTSIRANYYSALFIPVVVFLSGISTATIIWYGGGEVVRNNMQFGTLMMFTSYVNLFFEPLRQIARLIAELQMAQASAERVISLLNQPNDIVDSPSVIDTYGSILTPKPENYDKVFGDIVFENINFHYQASEPVLKDFNLTVKKGETIALVGETGSGKSTIVNLLCRFYEPISGRVLVDGVDYKERSIGWLHDNLGYVLQSPHLFSGSIKDNIRYGKLDATDEEIIAAAKKVNAHEFITSFMDGYNSDVGEDGSKLSTGQKQLISFARAIIKDPAIFVLDEATASIDTETEQIVQYAVDKLLKDKTSFIVAHRLSTIVNADKIIVIQKGEIVESGSHQELIALKGYYYRLYTNQFNEEVNASILSNN
ncbi:MAG: ABC transporter ATP-binding protein [Erysipelothrix sp.]|nr:ABC transporter ATP-binding protein [Erysipelothrix sp.]